MPRLPALSGREVIRGLERLGFERISQKGSHIKLRKGSTTVIVPDHRVIRKGTLSSILSMSGVSVAELIGAISH